MKLIVDKRNFLQAMEWAKKLQPESIILDAGLDELTVYVTTDTIYGSKTILADVEEEGTLSYLTESAQTISSKTLDGMTLTIHTDDSELILEGSENQISLEYIETETPSFPTYEKLGIIDLPNFRHHISIAKECVARKTESNSDELLEASLQISDNTLTLLSTNRFSLWNSILTIKNPCITKEITSGFIPSIIGSSLEDKGTNATLIANDTHFGLTTESLTVLFPKTQTPLVTELNPVLLTCRQAYNSSDSVKFLLDSSKLGAACNAIKKINCNVSLDFNDDKSIKARSTNIGSLSTKIEKPAQTSFSLEFKGDKPVESIIVNPVHLLKAMKGVSTKNVLITVPVDRRLPIGISNEGDNVITGSIGIVTTIKSEEK